MANAISNSHDIIDSRDVIDRIEELRDEFETAITDKTDVDCIDVDNAVGAAAADESHVMHDEAVELVALEALAKEGEGYSDWQHGAALIRDSYFETYAREFAEEIGAIPNDAAWPCTCIDWEQAARELRMDYTSVEFDGVTYWVR
jgi:hypothetical protein